jgi:hypothetical protein|mmetsp:Transcript_852/g.1050  ORF Transcript_852/g.1050 Transcript_852/m.1050 type:complete len:184 (-) Transcript_852:143-694(-)
MKETIPPRTVPTVIHNRNTDQEVRKKKSTNHHVNACAGALIPYVPRNASVFRMLSPQTQKHKHNVVAANLNTRSEKEPLPHLIVDIIPTILSYCDGPTVARASCVCREWHQFSQCNELWENLCKHRFGVSASEIKPSPDPVKRLYIMSHRQLKEACRQNTRVSNVFTGRTLGPLRAIPVASLR